MTFEIPANFCKGKPKMPEVGPSTELVDLVSGESWLLLQVAEVNQVYVQIWPADLTVRSFLSFVDFIKGLTCVNDCSERNIRLIQDFVSGFKSRGYETKPNVSCKEQPQENNPTYDQRGAQKCLNASIL